MIRIHFVGDGPRDAATIPELVGTIVEAEIQLAEHSVTNWFHLRDKRYEKKETIARIPGGLSEQIAIEGRNSW